MIDPEAIEAHVFANSKSKDEYLELTARVIIHFKNLNEELQKENSSIDNHKNVLQLQLPSNSMENKQGNNNVHSELKRGKTYRIFVIRTRTLIKPVSLIVPEFSK